ncbi:hypothetical protein VDGE_30172 [Verticillium dahliae]|uniref:Uncharacterized protein n=1 Tax=Verticillium dahliae TaxID=27337 RepID=A0A444RRG7_VERDA|nr:hypothetical protein VDGE_30172 [Verticillium dahliae]
MAICSPRCPLCVRCCLSSFANVFGLWVARPSKKPSLFVNPGTLFTVKRPMPSNLPSSIYTSTRTITPWTARTRPSHGSGGNDLENGRGPPDDGRRTTEGKDSGGAATLGVHFGC